MQSEDLLYLFEIGGASIKIIDVTTGETQRTIALDCPASRLLWLCLAALFDLPAGATIVWSLAGVAILYWLSVPLAKACIGSRHAPQLHRGVSRKD